MDDYHEIFTPIPYKKRSIADLKNLLIIFIIISFAIFVFNGVTIYSILSVLAIGLIFYFRYLWNSARDMHSLIEIKADTCLEIKYLKKDVEEYFKSDLKNASISKSHTYTTPTTVYLKITSREKVLRFYEFSSEELDKNKIEAIRKKINELKRSNH